MLVPVAQHQARFLAPGLTADPRGIAFGRMALAVLPSLDRALSTLRSLTADVDLEDMYRDLHFLRLRSSIGAMELVLSFPAVDTHLLDRVSTLAGLHGGEVLTGDGRHMVRYRDRHSPLGYDVERVVESDGDLVLYGRLTEGSYEVEERVSLRQLAMRVVTEPARRRPARSGPGLILCAPGLRADLERCLFRYGVEAEVARVEPKESPSRGDGPRAGGATAWTSRGGFLYRVPRPPERFLSLIERIPGVRVFNPEGEHAGVESGFTHPLSLHACAPALAPFGLHLFEGGRPGALVIQTEDLLFSALRPSARVVDEGPFGLAPLRSPVGAGLDLTLSMETSAVTEIDAVMVPREHEGVLLRLLYLLPASAVEGYRAAVLEQGGLIVGAPRVEGVPLGAPLTFFGEGIFLPAGKELRPRVSSDRAAKVLGGTEGRYVVFVSAGEAPISIPHEAMEPIDTAFIRRLAALEASCRSLPEATTSPRVTFGERPSFPLWGGGARAVLLGSGPRKAR